MKGIDPNITVREFIYRKGKSEEYYDGCTTDLSSIGVDNRHGWPAEVDKQFLSGLSGVPLLAFPYPVMIAELGVAQNIWTMFSLVILPK